MEYLNSRLASQSMGQRLLPRTSPSTSPQTKCTLQRCINFLLWNGDGALCTVHLLTVLIEGCEIVPLGRLQESNCCCEQRTVCFSTVQMTVGGRTTFVIHCLGFSNNSRHLGLHSQHHGSGMDRRGTVVPLEFTWYLSVGRRQHYLRRLLF